MRQSNLVLKLSVQFFFSSDSVLRNPTNIFHILVPYDSWCKLAINPFAPVIVFFS